MISTGSPSSISSALRTAFFTGRTKHWLFESGNTDVENSVSPIRAATFTDPKPPRRPSVSSRIISDTARGTVAKCHALSPDQRLTSEENRNSTAAFWNTERRQRRGSLHLRGAGPRASAQKFVQRRPKRQCHVVGGESDTSTLNKLRFGAPETGEDASILAVR